MWMATRPLDRLGGHRNVFACGPANLSQDRLVLVFVRTSERGEAARGRWLVMSRRAERIGEMLPLERGGRRSCLTGWVALNATWSRCF